jgi:hypothetical protein
MANFPRGPAPIVVFLLSAFPCAAGFAADPAKDQSEKKGDVTVKSEVKPPEMTRAYLLAQGFKASDKDPEIFTAERMRLGDAARRLGFAIESLNRVPNRPRGQDVRGVQLKGAYCIVRSERALGARGVGGRPRLDKSETVCNVMVSLGKPNAPSTTDSNPRVTVKAVVVPKEHAKPLKVTFEIAAEGKLPLGIWFNQIQVRLTRGKSELWETLGQPPEDCEEFEYLIKPGSPRTFTVTAPDEGTLQNGEWNGLASGKYAVQVVIDGQTVLRGDAFDYSWINGRPRRDCKVESKKFEFTVK